MSKRPGGRIWTGGTGHTDETSHDKKKEGKTMREELEITRRNVTPAQFVAYVRSTVRKKGITSIDPMDIDLDYFAAGNDHEFNRCTPKHMEEFGYVERSISKPYEMQTYIRNADGTMFNEIMDFTFWDDKTGSGYFYLISIW